MNDEYYNTRTLFRPLAMIQKGFISIGIAVALWQSGRVWADESSQMDVFSTNQPSLGQLGVWVAPQILRCAKGPDCDGVAARSYAFLLLKMPLHARETLNSIKGVLPPVETAVFESAIERITSEQNVEYYNFLRIYVELAHSPNSLLDAHLSKLKSLTGEEVAGDNVTNSSAQAGRIAGQDDVIVTISRDWLSQVCQNGSYRQLADQLQLITGLRNHAQWRVVAAVSDQLRKEAMRIRVVTEQASNTNAVKQIYPGDSIFAKDPLERQRAREDAILNVMSLARPDAGCKGDQR